MINMNSTNILQLLIVFLISIVIYIIVI